MKGFELQNIIKSYPDGDAEVQVLKGVDLRLVPGELTALVGSSGSGKSTLLTIAAGLQRATEGRILLDGRDLAKMSQEEIRKIRASRFGFVFQAAHLVPFLSVEEQLALMLEVSENKLDVNAKREKANAMLKLVGMEHRRKAYPASLSGGEKQRVAIARAIIHEPRLLFADEPTASLDSKRTHEIMQLIQGLTRTFQMSTLLVTHDEETLAYADRVVTMKDGQIIL
ncbi:ABC transporter ATP-binding protein [Cohnella sp. AR92]|uniref:ABC transporter ATP-binding protein n=1 Tax=Cohnella sp. AR92 TaxID=648716 RepID=UPI000F8D5BB5|nr:ABC transporter ATP-binding protein [Cohnella sp. AR92]RUS47302.1 ABC transporter ATP-binding protein [Cohnella sp. AR92]